MGAAGSGGTSWFLTSQSVVHPNFTHPGTSEQISEMIESLPDVKGKSALHSHCVFQVHPFAFLTLDT